MTVIPLRALKRAREARDRSREYIDWVRTLDKHELLEEMIRFQEVQTQLGKLTLELMIRGEALFELLEQHAESEGLRILSRSYRRYLKSEYAEFIKKSEAV